jgi:prepilin-type N-terminal cleavage/methylation domain-containing protein
VRDESGYSLVEVLAAIVILAVAIIPMVGMFDAGLRAAVQGGNYDTARALANEKMEEVRALDYGELVARYPPGAYGPSESVCSTGVSGFSCEVTTDYVNNSLQKDSSSTSGLQIEVRVTWDVGKEYTTTGLKTRGQPD